jgi:hypothetical protein
LESLACVVQWFGQKNNNSTDIWFELCWNRRLSKEVTVIRIANNLLLLDGWDNNMYHLEITMPSYFTHILGKAWVKTGIKLVLNENSKSQPSLPFRLITLTFHSAHTCAMPKSIYPPSPSSSPCTTNSNALFTFYLWTKRCVCSSAQHQWRPIQHNFWPCCTQGCQFRPR